MLRGLFIGIDRYRPPVTRLSCARANAVALSSLFHDNNNSGQIITLVDDDATLDRIRAALDGLREAGPDDLVFVSFSGHGTPDHRLVPVDVDPAAIADSCLSLDELAKRLDHIPASQMIVVLDCCFSGGFGGARVFAPVGVRSVSEDRSSLEQMARGSGRLVLTASGAGEPALETVRYGHGLLTYHLVDALQGPPALDTGGRVPVLGLIEYVTTHVVDAANLLGEEQTPTLYGSFEGAPTLPVLTPGAMYSAAFPSRVRPPVDGSWTSLLPYGLTAEVLNRWSSLMPGLNSLQQRAVNEYGVLDGKSLLVVAPTASGKTMIGELAAVQHALRGSRTVMLLPLKALVNDKFEYFTRVYGDQITVVRATGDHANHVGAIYNGQYDVALLTYEKFLNLVVGSPFLMRGVSLVVVDEAQNISDHGRGASLEFLLTLIRSGHARGGAPQVIALSAVIGDTNGLERWLGAELLRTAERPVPLRESVVAGDGSVQHLMSDGVRVTEASFVAPEWMAGGQGSKPLIIPLVRRLVAEGKKVIVFRAIKGETVGTAGYLSQALGLPPSRGTLDQLPAGDLSVSSDGLRQALGGGVGFHNSDLDREERATLESEFRDPTSDLRVIVATTTLAMGVNTPAEAVVIAGLTHPGPTPQPYSVAEYKNMVGRAGRLGHVEAGESYIIASSQIGPVEAWSHYVLGQPEPVVSHFLAASTDPQTLILRSLAALGSSVQENALLALLENSFAIWQAADVGASGAWDTDALRRDLESLTAAGLIDLEPNGALTLTELGRFAGESGIEVRSVTQVSSALRFATQPLSLGDVILLAQVTVELDAVYFPVHKTSRQEQQRWPATLSSLGVQYGLLNGLHVGGGLPMVRAKRAAACLLFTSSQPMAAVEQDLMQHLRDRSAAGPIRAVAARTRDVAAAVATIARVQGIRLADEEAIDRLAVMLEIGLPAELGSLGELVGNALTRAEYLSLLAGGLSDPNQIQAIEQDHLTGLIGKAAATRLKDILIQP